VVQIDGLVNVPRLDPHAKSMAVSADAMPQEKFPYLAYLSVAGRFLRT